MNGSCLNRCGFLDSFVGAAEVDDRGTYHGRHVTNAVNLSGPVVAAMRQPLRFDLVAT